MVQYIKGSDFMTNCCILAKIKLNYALLMDFVMERFKTFSVCDIGIFKLCLFALGLIFGSAFSQKVKKFAPIVAIIAISSYIYLMYKIFFVEE